MADPNAYNNFRAGNGSSGRNQQENLELFFADLKTLGISVDEKTPQKALEIIKSMGSDFSKTITKPYQRLALKFHPDKNRDDPDAAEEKFKILTAANENLNTLKNKDLDLESCKLNLKYLIKNGQQPAPQPQTPPAPQRQPQPPSPPPAPQQKTSEPIDPKNKEQSIQETWSSFANSLIKLKEDLGSSITVASSSIADASSKINSSLESASINAKSFSSTLKQSANERVDSLIEISTSVTTSITQASSNAMDFLTSINPPQIKINLPSDETDAQKSTKTSPEPKKKEPEKTYAEETLGKKIREKLKRREQEERVAEAIKMAQAASLRAQEEAKKAAPPTQMRRTSSSHPGPARDAPPANNQRASSFSTELPRRDTSRIAFFGKGTKGHREHPKSNHPEAKRRKAGCPEANGPRNSTAYSLDHSTTKTTRR
jgi:curved DNA-binding protein CbpA